MDHDMNQTPQAPQSTKETLNPPTNRHGDKDPIPQEIDSREFNFPEESDLPQPSTPPMAFPKDPNYELHDNDQLSHLEPPPKCYPGQLEKPLMKSSLSKRHFSPSTGKTPREEKEAVSELLTILVDCMEGLNIRSRETLLHKFFSEIERDERLEKFIVERLTQSKVEAISDLCEKLPPSVLGKFSRSNSEGGNYSGSIEEDPKASSSNDDGEIPSFDDEFSESVENYGTSERSLIETVEDLSQELERFKVRTLEVGGVAQEEGKK